MRQEVIKYINIIRPQLQLDGGDIELIDVEEKTGLVKVKLVGACSHCPMATLTLKEGVEKFLSEKIPQVKKVISV